MQIVFDLNCLEETDVRLFPVSKHRSKRIHKKLIKRFGGEFRKQPCMYQFNGRIYAHPTYRAQIEAVLKTAASPREPGLSSLMRGYL